MGPVRLPMHDFLFFLAGAGILKFPLNAAQFLIKFPGLGIIAVIACTGFQNRNGFIKPADHSLLTRKKLIPHSDIPFVAGKHFTGTDEITVGIIAAAEFVGWNFEY